MPVSIPAAPAIAPWRRGRAGLDRHPGPLGPAGAPSPGGALVGPGVRGRSAKPPPAARPRPSADGHAEGYAAAVRLPRAQSCGTPGRLGPRAARPRPSLGSIQRPGPAALHRRSVPSSGPPLGTTRPRRRHRSNRRRRFLRNGAGSGRGAGAERPRGGRRFVRRSEAARGPGGWPRCPGAALVPARGDPVWAPRCGRRAASVCPALPRSVPRLRAWLPPRFPCSLPFYK